MSLEPNHTSVRQQYFELRRLLNHSNKQRDLQTELEFELRESELEFFIIIKSTGATHGLRLAQKAKGGPYWALTSSERFEDFFKYMFLRIFNLSESEPNLNNELAGWLTRLWVSQLISE